MKISSVSKKVLASALSAAMVVAFAPTVAFGAQDSQKLTVKYDLGLGVDKNAGTQNALASSVEYTVGGAYIDAVNYTDAEVAAAKAVQDKAAQDAALAAVAAGTDTSSALYNEANRLLTNYSSAYPGGISDVVTDWNANHTTNPGYDPMTALVEAIHATTYTGAALGGVKTPAHYATAGEITLETLTASDIVLKSGTTGYELSGWLIGYDADGDGKFTGKDDIALDANPGTEAIDMFAASAATVDVSNAKVTGGMTLTAIAQYNAGSYNGTWSIDNDGDGDVYKCATVGFTNSYNGTVKNADAGYIKVTDPSGAETTKALNAATNKDYVAPAQVGEYTVELVDGNGVTIDKQTYLVGALQLTGGEFAGVDGYATTSQTVYYKAQAKVGANYKDVLDNSGLTTAQLSAKKKIDGVERTAAYFVDANGNKSNTDAEVKTAKGGVLTVLNAYYTQEGATILGANASQGTVTITAAGIDALAAAPAVADPSTAADDSTAYYLVLKDTSGAVVAETAKTGSVTKAFTSTALDYSSFAVSNVEAGSYTATLFKVTGKKTSGSELSDASAAGIKEISSKTVEVKGVTAPTWSFAPETDATKTTSYGVLSIENAAGAGHVVKYLLSDSATTPAAANVTADYDTTKGGIAINSTNYTKYVYIVAKATDPKADPTYSNVVKLSGFKGALGTVDTFGTKMGLVKVNKQATVYYGQNETVKAAIAAAKKSLSDTGYKVVTGKEWDADVIAAEQAIVDAVAAVAKAEVEKLYAGTTDKDGNLTKISSDNYEKALAAIVKVSADYAANHDGDKTNNVAKNGTITYADNEKYAEAIDAALQDAAAATVTYKKADVDAAAAVTAQLKDPKTAAAGLEAYKALSAAAKELVAAADVAAAEEAVAAAKLVKAQDQSAARGAKAQVKGVTYKIKAKGSKTIKIAKSASGAKVTLKQVSGTKYAKVSGTKVTLKKAAKKGKKYTIKVKAVCGATTTSTVSFKVLVK